MAEEIVEHEGKKYYHDTKTGGWYSQEFKDACQEIHDKFWAGMLWGCPKREPKEDDNVKYAYVIIKGKRVMAGVDNVTMKGYELREDMPTWKLPLVPLEYDSFDRWCRGMDL